MKKLLFVLVAALVLLGLAVTVSAYDVPPSLQGRAIQNPDGSWMLVGPHWTGGIVQLLDEEGPPWWVNLTDPAGNPVYQVALDFGPGYYIPSESFDVEVCYNEQGEPWAPAERYPIYQSFPWVPGEQMDIKGKLTFTPLPDGSYQAEMDVYQVKYFTDESGNFGWGYGAFYWWRNPGKPPWAKNDKNMNQCWQAAP
jgi:hypothetical protein